jgi:hypothetical protein
LSVSDDGYYRNVSDEGYYINVSDEDYYNQINVRETRRGNKEGTIQRH